MGKRCLSSAGLIAAALAALAASNAEPDADVRRRVWDLTPIYASPAEWEADRERVVVGLREISRFRGRLGTSADSLADGLDAIAALRGRAGKLAIYGFLVSETDTTDREAQRFYDVGTSLESQVEAAVSFASGEIREVGRDQLQAWLAVEPRLRRYRSRLNRILEEAPYAPGPEAQAVLEDAARWPRLSADMFETLHESDLGWPRTDAGRPLDRQEYLRIRRSAASSRRTDAMLRFLRSLERLQAAFGMLYTRRVEADLVLARHRRFASGIDALWRLRDGMPPGSCRTMIDTTREHLDVLRRFARLRARATGRRHPSYADLFTPAPGTPDRIPLQQAMEIADRASAPLGPSYVAALRETMRQPWLHLPPLPHKRSTYAIWPPVAGIPPYVQMNYDGSYDSARRFTGAMTLMMSFDAWRRADMPDARDDPGIYSNGIIYVGDTLFDEFMAAHATDRLQKTAVLVGALDFFRAQFFQWVLAADFDSRVESLIQEGNTPDGPRLSEIYLGLLREYYGPEVDVADDFGREWMLNAVPFLSYEHQFWPAAVAAASRIVEGLRCGDPASRRAVDGVLGFGDTDRTYGLLRACGIDLSTPEPYLAAFARMNRLMDDLETLLP